MKALFMIDFCALLMGCLLLHSFSLCYTMNSCLRSNSSCILQGSAQHLDMNAMAAIQSTSYIGTKPIYTGQEATSGKSRANSATVSHLLESKQTCVIIPVQVYVDCVWQVVVVNSYINETGKQALVEISSEVWNTLKPQEYHLEIGNRIVHVQPVTTACGKLQASLHVPSLRDWCGKFGKYEHFSRKEG